MRKYSRVTLGVSLVAVAASALAACSSSGGSNSPKSSGAPSSSGGSSSSSNPTKGVSASYNAATDAIVNPSTKTGGTLNLGAESDCDSWDPKISYYGWCLNMHRLYSRTLIGYSVVNGKNFKLAPDLATGMGKHNATFTQWTYTLKPGLKFSTGKAITPLDIKYGLERNWAAAVIPGGPSAYYVNGIKAPKGYPGPYKGGDLSTITTTANSITINLTAPNANFDYLMAFPPSAPVPYKVEGGANFKGATYTKHPVSSGPFMVKSYTPGKEMSFVRNPYWQQSTDTIRHPLVNAVNVIINTNPVDLNDKLKAGTLDANASTGSSGLGVQFQSYVLTHPDAKKNVDDAENPATNYFAVMQSVVKNADCRKAIFYATNKASILAAYGGPTAGTLTGSFTPPGIPGYDPKLDPYPTGKDYTGDLTKAKAALKACGKPSGFSMKYAYATPGNKAPLAFAAEKAALARVGIKLSAVTDDSSTYYNTFIGSPKNIINQQIGMAFAGWGADYPRVEGFYTAITSGSAIVDPGNSNYASLNDPVVNKLIAEAPSGKATAADSLELNKQVLKSAVYMPLYFSKTLLYRNPRMTNVTCNNALAFGNYDFVNIGVTK